MMEERKDSAQTNILKFIALCDILQTFKSRHQITIHVIQAFRAVWFVPFVLVVLPYPAVRLANMLNQLYSGIQWWLACPRPAPLLTWHDAGWNVARECMEKLWGGGELRARMFDLCARMFDLRARMFYCACDLWQYSMPIGFCHASVQAASLVVEESWGRCGRDIGNNDRQRRYVWEGHRQQWQATTICVETAIETDIESWEICDI